MSPARRAAMSCWLPGGYPELHAGALAARRFGQGSHSPQTRPVHGECGGYMVLGEGLVDAGGARHAMVGLLTHAMSFAERRLHLGYRAATLLQDCPLGVAGTAPRSRIPLRLARRGGQRQCAARRVV